MYGVIKNMKCFQLSSLEKVFLNGKFSEKEYTHATALKGEKFSYQLAFINDNPSTHYKSVEVKINSSLSEYIKLYRVGYVPSALPANINFGNRYDDDYITTEPGLFPDCLYPLCEGLEMYCDVWNAVWVEISLPKDIEAGKYQVETEFLWDDGSLKKVFNLEVVNFSLPPQELKFTQWFYCDCLYTYYNEEPFSEGHWKIIENFAKMAADNGMNMILTPVITPTLDVDVGRDRPENQLTLIYKEGDSYTFDFKRLERWVKMCDRVGIKYFEIAHMFTQWGAKSAPRVMAYENGEYKKLFGWDTPATGDEYINFLNQFIPALLKFIDDNNLTDRVYFHISDEPSLVNIESYKAAHSVLAPLLSGRKCMDALSKYEFYEQGLVKIPVVANNHIKPFLDKDIPELWAYYCCSQSVDVSNRFMAMPSYRNRIIGTQLYKYDIKGFLHWGYNFYYAARTRAKINPYIVTDAVNTFPSGDAFSVYPGDNGVPYPSLRLLVFKEALQDLSALKALEKKIGYDKVIALMEEDIDFEIEFDKYPKSADYILNLREKVNRMLAE